MNETNNSNYDELLKYSLKMLHRGDSFVSIDNYLNHKNATEEENKKIFSIISKEHKILKESNKEIENKIEKNNLLKSSFLQLFIGVFIMIVGWFFYSKGINANAIMFIPLIALVGGLVLSLIGALKILITLFHKKN